MCLHIQEAQNESHTTVVAGTQKAATGVLAQRKLKLLSRNIATKESILEEQKQGQKENCFRKFRPEIKNQLIPANTPLDGFSGEIIWHLGQILLLVRIGDEEHSTSAQINFMVVRSPSLYKRIIGRSGVKKIRSIPSTAHRIIKFPVAGRIVTLQSSRIIPLECSMVSEPKVLRPSINQVKEEKI
nr:reverse transcriptase domain-containing protein [Tanacetum cinerariifolium]